MSISRLSLALVALIGLVSCVSNANLSLPVSADQQATLTPAGVLADLLEGNERFVRGDLSSPNVRARVEATASGQYPKALVLSCIDSRVPVEQVFDQGLGDIFVGRVAGNVENEDQLGSMEFATKLAGVKLVMVLGHESCGAVKGACDSAQLGNLTGLLDKIQPAVRAVTGFASDERTSKNKAFVADVVEANVRQTVSDIRSRSAVLAELEQQGDIAIVGALYSLGTGRVQLVD